MTSAIRAAATVIALLLLVSMWIGLFVAYPGLPPTVPTHFGFDGRPVGYEAKTSLVTLPIVASVTCAFLLAVTRISRRRPNLPFKVPEEAMPRVSAILQAFMATQALLAAAIFFVVQQLTFAVVRGATAGPGASLMLAIGVYEIAAFAVFFTALSRLRA